VYIQVARGQKWLSLPEDLRGHICVELLDKGADTAWLSVLEDMHRQEPSEFRLTAVCVKVLCDHREYPRAFAVINRAIVDRAQRTFSKDPDGLIKDLAQLVRDMETLLRIKDFADLQNRKDALPRPDTGEVERIYLTARDICRSMLPDLSDQDQGQLLLGLLKLAESSEIEKHILEVAELFFQSSARNDASAHAEFMRRLQNASVYTRVSPRRAQLVAKSKQQAKTKTVTERTFLTLFQKQTGHSLRDCMDGTEADAIKLLTAAINLIQRMGIGTVFPSIRKAARQVLLGLADPELKFSLCLKFVRLDEDLRLLAVKTLRECLPAVDVKPDQVAELVTAFQLVNDPEQLRALHAGGLLDTADLHPSYLADLYATMGLFREGAERMKRARHAAIVEFSKTGEISHFNMLTSLTDRIAEIDFLQRSSEILNSVPQPKSPQGLIVVVAKGPHEVNQFPILALRELKQRGFAVLPLAVGALQYQPTGIPEIDEIADQLNLDFNYARYNAKAIPAPQPSWLSRIPLVSKFIGRSDKGKWVWDPARFEISYAGVNAYWGIREDLCCMERRYTVDFHAHRYKDYLADIRMRIEIWERLLHKICAVGKGRSIPVRLILQYVHLSTHYYCRKYIEAANAEQDISVIHSGVAYENYFTNFVKDESTSLAVQDMTKLADLAASSYAPREWFLRYYKSLPEDERDQIVDAVEQITRQNRVRRDDNANALKRLQFFKFEREQGRRVVALFGKVLFDQGLPRGDGVVHEDMRDWFDHSIDIARRNPNLHLIIKPHPHELREEIALYASEVLKDWLPNPVPDNVHFLRNDEFNLYELTEILDLALVWNGMSALELGALSVPTILGAYYGAINFPVGHIVPTSRQDFEHVIMSYSKNRMSNEVKRMSAAYIDYLRHPEISVPYRYTYRGFTNRHIQLHWFAEDLAAYESHGDKHVTILADRIAGVQDTRDLTSRRTETDATQS
jgi:hypothetical protein